MRPWDRFEVHEHVDGLIKCFVDFVLDFLWKVCQCAKTFAPTFSVVLFDQDCVVTYTSICFVEIG